ncbi:MAG TPA: hypothetical protein VN682_11805 [Terriglobales bacterium]|nr:hypothetical protein [Terriglobales bacterium]
MKTHAILTTFRRYIFAAAIMLVGTALFAAGQQMPLGRTPAGGEISFTRAASGEWGIEITGGPAPRIAQAQPAAIEVYRADDDIRELSAGYKTVRRTATGIDAVADVPSADGVIFHVHDFWSLSNGVLSVRRELAVRGNAPGGFDSVLDFSLDSAIGWPDINFMAPGAIYADPTYDGDRSPGGTLTYAARRLVMREDILAAPLFALSFENGASIAMLDPHPRGDTTEEESKLTKLVMTDARIQFGAMGAWQAADGTVHFGFRYPSTTTDFGGGRPAGASPVTADTRASTTPAPPATSAIPPKMRWIRRYHPMTDGFTDSYEIRFRFGQNESFRDVTRDAWRWAWNTLNPPILDLDVNLVRRVLLDHLEAQAATIDGRTGIPFVLSTVADQKQWNWTMIAMGFVGKNLECADQLLQEGDRDHTERGQKMRETGLAIISSMIQALHSIPLEATGYDLSTGKPWDHFWVAPWLRNATEDMNTLMQAYQRELALGRPHPEWLAWVKSYSDWLVEQQRPDGSFPRRWKPGTNEVMEPTGTGSYNVVPLFVLMTQITGDQKYQASALRAAEYVWSTWGTRGLFIGGASDNPNITDKEAGMLSLKAYLSLYDATKNPKWLERAKAAGNFAESWIWIWNLPMPADADNALLHWKKGVPTVGLQDITAANTGGTDEYLDWAVPSYARLYNDTHDPHYLAVARVLLMDTKSMVALPGRQYDMKGIGWQQENFRLGPGPSGRGVGSHRFWLPWVSANHLHGIVGLDDYDPALYKQLSARPDAKGATKE